jgi:predicted DNA repair protein MutK
MFMVGGGILLHAVSPAYHLVEGWAAMVSAMAFVGPVLAALLPTLVGMVLGIVAGAFVLAGVQGFARLRGAAT